MKWKHVVVEGIIAGLVIEAISLAVSWLTQTVWQYNVLDVAGMRSIDDPIMILFFVYPWVLGFALSYVFVHVEKSWEGTSVTKGWKFGLLMWVVVSIPSGFLVFASMNYPVGFTINSIVGSLLYLLAAGIVIAKIFDWMK